MSTKAWLRLASAVTWAVGMLSTIAADQPWIIGLGAVCIAVGVYVFVFSFRAKPKTDQAKKPAGLPADLLMPYCLCPKCGVEALHWMRAPKRPTQDDITRYIQPHFGMRMRDELYSWEEQKFSCIRTCRECGKEWGQHSSTTIKETA